MHFQGKQVCQNSFCSLLKQDLHENQRIYSPFPLKKTSFQKGFDVQGDHYENTPIQIYRKFHLQNLKIFK